MASINIPNFNKSVNMNSMGNYTEEYKENQDRLIELSDVMLGLIDRIYHLEQSIQQNQKWQQESGDIKKQPKFFKEWKSIKRIERNTLIHEIRRDYLIEIDHCIRNLLHITGIYLFIEKRYEIHNEYYRLEDMFIRLQLYKVNAENYSNNKVMFVAFDILKLIQQCYPEKFIQ